MAGAPMRGRRATRYWYSASCRVSTRRFLRLALRAAAFAAFNSAPAELVECLEGLEGLEGQPLHEVCGRDRFAEEKTLSAVAPQLPDDCQLSLGLDSFRSGSHVEAGGNPHRGIDQYPGVRTIDRVAD